MLTSAQAIGREEGRDIPEITSPSVEVSVDGVEDSTSTKMTFGWISSLSDTYRFFAYKDKDRAKGGK